MSAFVDSSRQILASKKYFKQKGFLVHQEAFLLKVLVSHSVTMMHHVVPFKRFMIVLTLRVYRLETKSCQ